MMNTGNPVILFDGICNFCCYWVNIVIRMDKKKKFRFATLQSVVGKEILLRSPFRTLPKDTFVLIEGNKYFTASSGVLMIAKILGGFWNLFYVFTIIPLSMRDFFYDFIARNRYLWYGKKESCIIPLSGMEDRFL